MHPFDRGIALTDAAPGRFRGTIDRTWWIDFGPNGGFLASVMLNAIQMTVDDPSRHPRSLSVHYPGRAAEGDFEIEVEILRTGRNMTFALARMHQDERVITTATSALSTERTGAHFHHAPPPEVAAPESIGELPFDPKVFPRFAHHFDYRLAHGAFPYSGAERAVIGGWIRPREPRPVDGLLLTTYADGFPPAAFTMSNRPFPIPTIDLTVHFRTPATGADDRAWCLAVFSSSYASQGFIEENGSIWARDGSLLAQTRQLALYGTEMGKAPFGAGG